MTNKLFLIRGLPGSGKTTIAEGMIKSNNNRWQHFEADDFFTETGKYVFVPENQIAAHAFCQYNAFKALENGENVIVSNTFTTVAEMLPYIIFAHRHMIRVRVIKAMGSFTNIHGVPEEVMQKMRDRWEAFDGEFECKTTEELLSELRA